MTSEKRIEVEITDVAEFHCFRLTLYSQSGHDIEVMLHAARLVDLIHECSVALCEWQRQTSQKLILMTTGLSEAEARARGLIA